MNKKHSSKFKKHSLDRAAVNPKAREKEITKSGYLFIATNFFLGIFNIIVGLLAGSIAITSDAIHSFIDSVSGFLIVIGEKLSSHYRFKNRRDMIERITTIMIAVIIIVAGVDIIVEAVAKILSSEVPDYSVPTIIVLIASIALKYLLASYLKHKGVDYNSTVLKASGAETMNDTWISVAVLGSAVFYLISGIDIEAYVSIIIAALIIKVGLEFIFPHLSRHHHHHLESNSDHDHCGKV